MTLRPSFDPFALGTDIQRRLGIKTSRDEPLARFTTMRVGGPADLFATVRNAFELRGLVRFARTRQVPHLVLGRGSNLVISDRGVRGLVIQVRAEGVRLDGERLITEAGLPMAKAATIAGNAGLAGLEFGLAIPGTVGGAVWANAGAHGADIASVIETADVVLPDGREVRLDRDALGLAYRESRFKAAPVGQPGPDGIPEPGELVVAAAFRLRPEEPEAIRARLDDIRRWRREHQPIGMASAGSVFRNPAEGPSAGALIDRAGLKGQRVGGAVVSDKHANFIVNDRKGSAADVRALAERVRDEIDRRDGVRLAFEVVFAGDWADWPWTEDAA